MGGPGVDRVRATLVEQARWGIVRALEGQGELEAALTDLEHLRDTLEPDSPLWLQAAVTAARCSAELGDLHRAVDVAELALADARTQGLAGTSEHAELVSTLVGCYERRGDAARAAQLAEDLLESADHLGNSRSRAAAYWNASLLAQRRGHLDKAVRWAERAVTLLADQDNERNLSRARVAFAWVLLRTQPPDVSRAVTLLRDAAVALEDHGTASDRAYAHTELSRALLMLGDPEAALAEATEAAALLSAGHHVEAVSARLAAADAWAVTGDFQLARDHVGEAVEALGRPAALAGDRAGLAALGGRPPPTWRRAGCTGLPRTGARSGRHHCRACPPPGARRAVVRPGLTSSQSWPYDRGGAPSGCRRPRAVHGPRLVA